MASNDYNWRGLEYTTSADGPGGGLASFRSAKEVNSTRFLFAFHAPFIPDETRYRVSPKS